jgi:uncharacterized Tic20 family protein
MTTKTIRKFKRKDFGGSGSWGNLGMRSKKGKSELEFGLGIIIFVVIMGIFLFQGVFTSIISAFTVPEFGGFGLILGVLFVLMIIAALFDKLFGK